MKYLISIILTIFIIIPIVCMINIINENSNYEYIIKQQDTIIFNNTKLIDSLTIELNIYKDSLETIRNSNEADLFVANYKLGRIRQYTNIVDKNSSQMKFYKGWIKRVLNN